MPLIELCVEGIDNAITAAEAGADRIELCAALIEGGITPSLATIRATVQAVRVPVMVMVRPRGGDFLYSDREFQTMVADIEAIREAGAAGVVFGCLTPYGAIDEPRTKALVEAAGKLDTTIHRAFDMTADPHEALEALIRCGAKRVLTSGQRPSGLEGAPLLAKLVRQAAGRIAILGCGDLDEATIAQVRRQASLTELHFAAPTTIPSAMRYRNPALAMGGDDTSREYRHTVTDAARVRRMIAAARA